MLHIDRVSDRVRIESGSIEHTILAPTDFRMIGENWKRMMFCVYHSVYSWLSYKVGFYLYRVVSCI